MKRFATSLPSAATLALTAALLVPTALAHAATLQLQGTLSAASEVPAKPSSGTGTVNATLDPDTHLLNYTIDYAGLTGPATMAHFHGPAKPGDNAGVALPLPSPLDSPIKGSATLTETQQKQLLDGLMYVNVHTAANPGGEVRGQVTAVK